MLRGARFGRLKSNKMNNLLGNNVMESTYHPHYIQAVLASETARAKNEAIAEAENWRIPEICFSTEVWTRRSMALNGMRMSTEYFASGSLRIFTLIEQRLAVRQSDVVHDVLVYLWERVLQFREEAREARSLQAESLAAYLRVDYSRTVELFLAPSLRVEELEKQITAGYAGVPRRQLELVPLLENLLARLQPELEEIARLESQVFYLIDEICLRLYESVSSSVILKSNS